MGNTDTEMGTPSSIAMLMALLPMWASCSPGKPPFAPPKLPSNFKVTITALYPGAPVSQLPNSTFYSYRNSSTGATSQLLDSSAGFFPTRTFFFRDSQTSVRIYSEFWNQDCRPLPANGSLGQAFYLSWLLLARYDRTVLIDKHELRVFLYSEAVTLMNYSLYVGTTGQIQQLQTQWHGKVPGTPANATAGVQTYIFRGAPDEIPPSNIQVPRIGCIDKVPPCKSEGIKTMDVYLAHPKQFFYLDNEDTGDSRGDVMFICPDIAGSSGSFGGANGYDAVSRWTVELDTRFGQYEQCNGYPGICWGREDFFIGRQLPFGSDKVALSRQCSANDQTGSWYSHAAG